MPRRFRKSDTVVVRRIRDEYVLVPVMGTMEALDSLYSLNEVAGEIWNHASAGLSEEAIVQKLMTEYDVDAATAAADTRTVLDQLVEVGALNVAPPH